MEHLDLTSKADTNMRALSGGMKRRVLVGQALVHKPPVIVLDEPTAGVDVELRQALWRFIRRLNRDGHTIVLTTHYLEEAEALCGRIAMLKQGQVVALDTTREPARAGTRAVTSSCASIPTGCPRRSRARVTRAPRAAAATGSRSRNYDELETLMRDAARSARQGGRDGSHAAGPGGSVRADHADGVSEMDSAMQ